MFEISRRDLVLGSTGAALVFGLKAPVSFIGAAQAQRASDSLKYKVGDIEVFSLHEEAIERVLDANSRQERRTRRRQEGIDRQRHRSGQVRQPVHGHCGQDRRQVVLFDTGFGGNGPATVGKLADNMKEPGLDPARRLPRW